MATVFEPSLLICLNFLIYSVLSKTNWCDSSTYNLTSDGAEKAKRIEFIHSYYQRACYFVLKEMKEKGLKQSSAGDPVSIDDARALCKEFSATLVTVHYHSESKFIKRLGSLILLGVNVTLPKIDLIDAETENATKQPTIVKWDDDLPANYRPANWRYPFDEPKNVYTYISATTNRRSEVGQSGQEIDEEIWETVSASELKKRMDSGIDLVIPCKQNLTIASAAYSIKVEFVSMQHVSGLIMLAAAVFGRFCL